MIFGSTANNNEPTTENNDNQSVNAVRLNDIRMCTSVNFVWNAVNQYHLNISFSFLVHVFVLTVKKILPLNAHFFHLTNVVLIIIVKTLKVLHSKFRTNFQQVRI